MSVNSTLIHNPTLFQETFNSCLGQDSRRPDTPRATLGAARLHKLELRDLVCLVVVVPVCVGAVAQADEGRNENGEGENSNFSGEIHGESPYWVRVAVGVMFRLRLQRAPAGIAACTKSDEGRNEYGEGEDGGRDSEVHG